MESRLHHASAWHIGSCIILLIRPLVMQPNGNLSCVSGDIAAYDLKEGIDILYAKPLTWRSAM